MAPSAVTGSPADRTALAAASLALLAARPSFPSASLAAQAYLADAFRARQAYLAAQSVARVLAIWGQLNLGDVRTSWPALRTALAAVIRDGFTESAQAGNAYFLQARQAAGVTADVPALAVPEVPSPELIQATVDSTGPWRLLGAIKSATQPVPDAVKNTGVVLSGASSRLILNGARQAVLTAVRDDPHAIAWMRVTSGSPCAWCAMLASRGPVYKTEQTAGFSAHGLCKCTAQAVWSESDAHYLAENNLLQQQWKQVTAGHSGKYAINAWRRYWYRAHPDAVGAPRAA